MKKQKSKKHKKSNKSPYKIFTTEKNIGNKVDSFTRTTLETTSYNISNYNSKNKHTFNHRPLTCKTRDDIEVSSISQRLKSMTLSNNSYINYINYYCNMTQDFTFKTPKIENYPLRKNEKFLPITTKPNKLTYGKDSIFLDFMKETETDNSKKEIEAKPYGYKYGETKIKINRKRAKSAYPEIINPRDFQNLCDKNVFESDLLNQIGLKKIDMYNSAEEKIKNYNYFMNYFEKFNNIDGLLTNDNSYKEIKFHARTAIIKNHINFKLEIFSLCFKFYLLGNKEKPQKLFFPFKLLPLFYLLDFQVFKHFLSEIIYYDEKNNCLAFIPNDLLFKKIKLYYNFVINTTKNNPKYLNYMTYNKNELYFYLIYNWVVFKGKENNNNNISKDTDRYKCYKLKITLPKIKFFIENYSIKIIKHLNKHIIANLIAKNFKNWNKFILFDLFSNKRFKTITNLVMLNKHKLILSNKIILNKEYPNNKRLEFYLSQIGEHFSHFYIFVPYIILVLNGEREKKYKKINLTLIESKNLMKFRENWGIINTLLKCMFINTSTNEIYFKFELLENIDNDLYKIITRENKMLKRHSIRLFSNRKNSNKNAIYLSKEKDKEKDKNKTKYKSNNLEISLLECTLKKLFISENNLESKYYKIPELLLKSIFKIKNEKDLFNNNFIDISIIGKHLGELSEEIINAPEENIVNEEQKMIKRMNELNFIMSNEKQEEKVQFIQSNKNVLLTKTINLNISKNYQKDILDKDINKINTNNAEDKKKKPKEFEIKKNENINNNQKSFQEDNNKNAFKKTNNTQINISNSIEFRRYRIQHLTNRGEEYMNKINKKY